MRFLSMVKSDAPSDAGAMPPPELFEEMARLSEEAIRNGTLLSQDGLAGSAKGAKVKFKAGKVTVLDGPFAESKELVAGFAILQLPDLDAAIAAAKRLPMKTEIEVRPIFDMEDFAAQVDVDLTNEAKFRAAAPPPITGKRFMFLMKSDATTESGAMPSDDFIAAMGRYNDQLVAAGALLAAEGLHPSSKGARVDLGAGTVTKGPFGDPSRIICGFWMIQAASKDAAIEWAQRAPIRDGEIEVRAVMEMADLPTGVGTNHQAACAH